MDAAFIVGGLVLLLLGGDLLVRGACRVGVAAGLSPVVVGMVIVGFGTSAPELFVGVQASARGAGGLALGNVVGSNIANILLILGATAAVMPIARPEKFFLADSLVLFLVSAGFLLLISTFGVVTSDVGLLMLGLLVLFIGVQVMRSFRNPDLAMESGDAPAAGRLSIPAAIAFIVAGFVGLGVGSELLVTGSVSVARQFGVSETLIGLTIIAIGTSLPELASTLIAALRGHVGVAYGNIVGSSIFNLLGIAGAAAAVNALPVDAMITNLDGPIMVGTTIVMLVMMATGRGIGRLEGLVMLGLYVGYIVYRTEAEAPGLLMLG